MRLVSIFKIWHAIVCSGLALVAVAGFAILVLRQREAGPWQWVANVEPTASLLLVCALALIGAATLPWAFWNIGRRPLGRPLERVPTTLGTLTVAVLSPLLSLFFVNWASAESALSQQRRERVVRLNDAVFVCGHISYATPAKVWAAAKNGGVDRVVLANNRGGVIVSGEKMAQGFKDHGITQVEVAGECNSACALTWAYADVNRVLGNGATLGFHQAGNAKGAADSATNLGMESKLIRNGFEADLATRIAASRPLIVMDAACLRAAVPKIAFSDGDWTAQAARAICGPIEPASRAEKLLDSIERRLRPSSPQGDSHDAC